MGNTLTNFSEIEQKIYAGKRLSFEDGVELLTHTDLLKLGQLANYVKEKKQGDKVYFIKNTHLNYTNICYMGCKYCAFGTSPDSTDAYALNNEEVYKKVKDLEKNGFNELHIVGGVNPKLGFAYYENLIQMAKQENPNIHIQAFTAVELDYIARTENITIQEAFKRLQKVGLGSILGGGAEIFHPEIRTKIAGHKTDATKWFEIHKIAHQLGMKSNASMLYGHIEKPEHVIDHLIRLRELQDETNGFNAFFGFSFQPENTQLGKEQEITDETSGYYDLKLLAVARLMLDNFPHIRAFWMLIGKKLAQVSLSFGVDDLDGTVMEEQIVHAAGNQSVNLVPKESFINMIKETGRVPVERDTLYNEIRTY